MLIRQRRRVSVDRELKEENRSRDSYSLGVHFDLR